jgi:mannose-1-phosphate guanylyltransferase
VAEAQRAPGLVRLGDSFARAPATSVDYAVFEKTDKAVVVRCDLGWSDVGARRGRRQCAPRRRGPVGAAGRRERSDGPTVALAGVDYVVGSVQEGVVLVTATDRPSAVKRLVEELKACAATNRSDPGSANSDAG